MKVTQEMIEYKVGELCDLIKDYEGGKADAASHCCFEIITWAADNHFEGVGILAETLFSWRGRSKEVREEEAMNEDCICQECQKELEEQDGEEEDEVI